MAQSRPLQLNPSQARELSAGKPPLAGEHSRPRAFTAKHIDVLRKGQDIKIDDVPALQAVEYAAKSAEAVDDASRPRDITEKDIAALREGKNDVLESREPLKPR